MYIYIYIIYIHIHVYTRTYTYMYIHCRVKGDRGLPTRVPLFSVSVYLSVSCMGVCARSRGRTRVYTYISCVHMYTSVQYSIRSLTT